MDRKDILAKFPSFAEGAKVKSRDDENLGKVLLADEDYFIIEKGLFFPRDFTVRYEDIADISDGTIHLHLAKEDLSEWRESEYAGWRDVENINTGTLKPTPRPEYKDRHKEYETKMPVAEEELEAKKRVHEAGGVKLHKVVHTEYKHFTVPVMKEEVKVRKEQRVEEREVAGMTRKEEVKVEGGKKKTA